MSMLSVRLHIVAAVFALFTAAIHAEDGQMTIGGGTVTAEAGGVKMESGDDGASLEAGGAKISEGNDGTVSIETGDKVGGRVSAGVGAEGENWNANAEVGGEAEADWSIGADEDGNVGVKAGARVGVDGSVTVGAHGQIGDDDNNVHGSGEITLSARAVVEIAAQLEMKKDGSVVARAEAKVGASVSAEATIKGGVTVWGVPMDVVLAGGVSAGAEASASAGAEFDAKTGKFKVTLEASAVLGVGARGNITVEIGIVQLAQAIGTGVGNAVEKIGEGMDKVGDAAKDLWDWIGKKWNGDDGGSGGGDDPFDSDPEGGGSSGGKQRYQGLKPLKLLD